MTSVNYTTTASSTSTGSSFNYGAGTTSSTTTGGMISGGTSGSVQLVYDTGCSWFMILGAVGSLLHLI